MKDQEIVSVSKKYQEEKSHSEEVRERNTLRIKDLESHNEALQQ